MAHADGEVASACAAGALGAGMVLSSLSSTPVEAVAAAMGSGPEVPPLWFQLYWQADRAHTLALVQRAQAAGCEALVLTVDAPCHGVRDRERRAGFALPPGVHAVHLPPHHRDNTANSPGKRSLAPLLAQAPTWADVQWLLGATKLPVILKGVLHPQDAAEAAALGVAAVIVSNHGGRVLDTTPPTAYMLPRLADAVQGRIPLLVDGGIRRGTDVLKAIALGATAVLLGRPVVYGLANAGAAGVAHVLRLLLDELHAAMALTGCASLADANPGLLHPLQAGLVVPAPFRHPSI
jgi:4-hydroxymandelate oxidase